MDDLNTDDGYSPLEPMMHILMSEEYWPSLVSSSSAPRRLLATRRWQ